MGVNSMDDLEEDALDRREFITTTTAVAAGWWALTAKNDALAQTEEPLSFAGGTDPSDQDYHYDSGP
jgi:hypothetical protein